MRRPASIFQPGDPIAALRAIADGLHLLPGVSPVHRLWLRDALRARLSGEAASIDAALGLPSQHPQPRSARTAARHALLRELAESTGVREAWAAAGEVALLLAGEHAPVPTAAALCARLRADPDCPRSLRQVYRVLRADTAAAVCVSTPPHAQIEPATHHRRRAR